MKLGLCFGGGGARGAYQIGACMALKEAGLLDQVEFFSGTSIGAANAALMACNTVDTMRDIWFNIPDETLIKTESFFKRIFKERTKVVVNGIYEIDNLEKVLRNNLQYEELMKKRVYVTLSGAGMEDDGFTALLKSSFKHFFKHESQILYSPLWEQEEECVVKQIMASCSIPIVFSPVTIDGKHYYDGGVYDDVPVKPLVDAGCDTIIVLHLYRFPYLYKHKYKDISFHPIKPRHSLGGLLNFNSEKSKIRFHYGYEDTKRYLEENKII